MLASQVPTLKIAIIGSGDVGCFYGAKLAKAGADVHFLMRRDFQHVQEHGLTIRSANASFALTHPQAHETTAAIGSCDLVIVALKATDNAALLHLLPPLLGKDTMILTLQNGLGNEGWLASHFGEERILGGLCFVCLNRVSPGVIEHYAQGTIALGEHGRPPMKRTRTVVAWFERAGIDCQLMQDLGLARWRKLVWNVPFNGLAIAGGGVDVSEILDNPSLAYLAKALMKEIITLAATVGYDIPLAFIDEQFVKTRQMGPYKPSSLLDFLADRPVEVDAIWGEAVAEARRRQVETHHLETLYHLLRALCRSS